MNVAIIGGTGVEEWPGAEVIERREIETSYGEPSAPLVHARIADAEVWFLSRHGLGHEIAPHRINYRANIDAIAGLGCDTVVALNAVGIIGDATPVGGLALPDQLIDYTWGRECTYLDGDRESLDHLDFTEPFDGALRRALVAAGAAAGIAVASTGVYGVTQGPRLETRAEVDRLERDGVTLIGMTAMPEAALARERGLAYACVALVVNAAAGRGDAPIHDDLVGSMASARYQATELVRSFLRASR
ncbi:MAG: S-methyl-5'-thioinosine phosphorylase [Pseudomonadota bacterium]